MLELARFSLIAVILALALWVKAVTAQRGPGFVIDFDAVEFRTEHVAGNVHMIAADGGNVGVLAGPDGILLVDDQFAELSEGLRAAIADIGDGPIRFVVNTHFHFDHTSGNANFASAGATIVAHENVRTVLSAPHYMETVATEFDAFPENALPVVTFTEAVSFHLNGEQVEVFHVPTAHTDGDAIVYFRTSDVVHMGDVFRARGPVYDFNNGGSYEGVIRALDRVVAAIGEQTRVIPGHGRIATREDLRKARDNMIAVRDRVARALAEQRGLAEIIAEDPTQGFEWSMPRLLSKETLVEWIYLELSRSP